jgi:hypothetical protein
MENMTLSERSSSPTQTGLSVTVGDSIAGERFGEEDPTKNRSGKQEREKRKEKMQKSNQQGNN